MMIKITKHARERMAKEKYSLWSEKAFEKAWKGEDDMALCKMIKIDNEIKQGKRKIWADKQVKKKYDLK